MDVKSAGQYMYGRIYDPEHSKPKEEHVRQVAVYAESVIKDSNFPAINGVKVRDLVFEDYEFGGGLIAYLSIERPTKGYGAKKVDLPKVHFTPFEIDPVEVDVYLDLYDEVEMHHQNNTVPGIPDSDDGMVWNGIRCSTRWCQRYSVCQGLVEPSNPKLKEALHG